MERVGMKVKAAANGINAHILIMANGNRRIPRADSQLNSFILTTTKVLLAPGPPHNWERLGMTEADRDDWKALHDEWVVAYGKCSDPTKRSSTVLAEKDAIRKRFTKFSYRLLVLAQTLTTITEDDRAVFRIPKRKKGKTKRAAMHDAPLVEFKNMAGGWLRVRARVAEAEGRAHLHRMADFMEIRYAVLPLGADPPETWSECRESTIRTKAISTLKLAQGQLGMKIYAFCRWVNSRENQKSGPWGTRIEAIVA